SRFGCGGSSCDGSLAGLGDLLWLGRRGCRVGSRRFDDPLSPLWCRGLLGLVLILRIDEADDPRPPGLRPGRGFFALMYLMYLFGPACRCRCGHLWWLGRLGYRGGKRRFAGGRLLGGPRLIEPDDQLRLCGSPPEDGGEEVLLLPPPPEQAAPAGRRPDVGSRVGLPGVLGLLGASGLGGGGRGRGGRGGLAATRGSRRQLARGMSVARLGGRTQLAQLAQLAV